MKVVFFPRLVFNGARILLADDDIYASVQLIDDRCKLSMDAIYMKCVRAYKTRD